jgi:hypothetical protein
MLCTCQNHHGLNHAAHRSCLQTHHQVRWWCRWWYRWCVCSWQVRKCRVVQLMSIDVTRPREGRRSAPILALS